jgi:hypothetical protein
LMVSVGKRTGNGRCTFVRASADFAADCLLGGGWTVEEVVAGLAEEEGAYERHLAGSY